MPSRDAFFLAGFVLGILRVEVYVALFAAVCVAILDTTGGRKVGGLLLLLWGLGPPLAVGGFVAWTQSPMKFKVSRQQGRLWAGTRICRQMQRAQGQAKATGRQTSAPTLYN